MIEIRCDENRLHQLVTLHRQILNAPYSLEDDLQNAIADSNRFPRKQQFFNVINEKLPEILFGKPEELQAILPEIEIRYDLALAENPSTLKNEISAIFDYDKFVRNYRGYGAYSLAREINLKVCPYCNRMSIITSETEDGRTRGPFDHWLCKDLYPYLSLSLFNLIPSCHPCNSHFKRTQKFTFTDHIHPYSEGYESEYNFAFSTEKAEIVEEDDFSIILKQKEDADTSIIHKAVASAQVFNISHVYNEEKHIALQIATDKAAFSEQYINDMLAKGVFQSREEYIRLRLHLKTSINDYCKETYSKFRTDLAKDLGLSFP